MEKNKIKKPCNMDYKANGIMVEIRGFEPLTF